MAEQSDSCGNSLAPRRGVAQQRQRGGRALAVCVVILMVATTTVGAGAGADGGGMLARHAQREAAIATVGARWVQRGIEAACGGHGSCDVVSGNEHPTPAGVSAALRARARRFPVPPVVEPTAAVVPPVVLMEVDSNSQQQQPSSPPPPPPSQTSMSLRDRVGALVRLVAAVDTGRLAPLTATHAQLRDDGAAPRGSYILNVAAGWGAPCPLTPPADLTAAPLHCQLPPFVRYTAGSVAVAVTEEAPAGATLVGDVAGFASTPPRPGAGVAMQVTAAGSSGGGVTATLLVPQSAVCAGVAARTASDAAAAGAAGNDTAGRAGWLRTALGDADLTRPDARQGEAGWDVAARRAVPPPPAASTNGTAADYTAGSWHALAPCFLPGEVVLAAGFASAGNNGLFLVTAVVPPAAGQPETRTRLLLADVPPAAAGGHEGRVAWLAHEVNTAGAQVVFEGDSARSVFTLPSSPAAPITIRPDVNATSTEPGTAVVAVPAALTDPATAPWPPAGALVAMTGFRGKSNNALFRLVSAVAVTASAWHLTLQDIPACTGGAVAGLSPEHNTASAAVAIHLAGCRLTPPPPPPLPVLAWSATADAAGFMVVGTARVQDFAPESGLPDLPAGAPRVGLLYLPPTSVRQLEGAVTAHNCSGAAAVVLAGFGHAGNAGTFVSPGRIGSVLLLMDDVGGVGRALSSATGAGVQDGVCMPQPAPLDGAPSTAAATVGRGMEAVASVVASAAVASTVSVVTVPPAAPPGATVVLQGAALAHAAIAACGCGSNPEPGVVAALVRVAATLYDTTTSPQAVVLDASTVAVVLPQGVAPGWAPVRLTWRRTGDGGPPPASLSLRHAVWVSPPDSAAPQQPQQEQPLPPLQDVDDAIRVSEAERAAVRRAACGPDGTCSGHGTCVVERRDGGATLAACVCAVGWAGASCAAAFLPCPPPGTCSGHGACDGTRGVCECEPGWQGPACDDDIRRAGGRGVAGCAGERGLVCSGRGACDAQRGACLCAPAWAPPNCAVAMCGAHGVLADDGSCTPHATWYAPVPRSVCALAGRAACMPSRQCVADGSVADTCGRRATRCDARGGCVCRPPYVGARCEGTAVAIGELTRASGGTQRGQPANTTGADFVPSRGERAGYVALTNAGWPGSRVVRVTHLQLQLEAAAVSLPAGTAAALFRAADLNGDGRLAANEYVYAARHPRLASQLDVVAAASRAAFAALDGDRDGLLSLPNAVHATLLATQPPTLGHATAYASAGDSAALGFAFVTGVADVTGGASDGTTVTLTLPSSSGSGDSSISEVSVGDALLPFLPAAAVITGVIGTTVTLAAPVEGSGSYKVFRAVPLPAPSSLLPGSAAVTYIDEPAANGTSRLVAVRIVLSADLRHHLAPGDGVVLGGGIVIKPSPAAANNTAGCAACPLGAPPSFHTVASLDGGTMMLHPPPRLPRGCRCHVDGNPPPTTQLVSAWLAKVDGALPGSLVAVTGVARLIAGGSALEYAALPPAAELRVGDSIFLTPAGMPLYVTRVAPAQGGARGSVEVSARLPAAPSMVRERARSGARLPRSLRLAKVFAGVMTAVPLPGPAAGLVAVQPGERTMAAADGVCASAALRDGVAPGDVLAVDGALYTVLRCRGNRLVELAAPFGGSIGGTTHAYRAVPLPRTATLLPAPATLTPGTHAATIHGDVAAALAQAGSGNRSDIAMWLGASGGAVVGVQTDPWTRTSAVTLAASLASGGRSIGVAAAGSNDDVDAYVPVVYAPRAVNDTAYASHAAGVWAAAFEAPPPWPDAALSRLAHALAVSANGPAALLLDAPHVTSVITDVSRTLHALDGAGSGARALTVASWLTGLAAAPQQAADFPQFTPTTSRRALLSIVSQPATGGGVLNNADWCAVFPDAQGTYTGPRACAFTGFYGPQPDGSDGGGGRANGAAGGGAGVGGFGGAGGAAGAGAGAGSGTGTGRSSGGAGGGGGGSGGMEGGAGGVGGRRGTGSSGGSKPKPRSTRGGRPGDELVVEESRSASSNNIDDGGGGGGGGGGPGAPEDVMAASFDYDDPFDWCDMTNPFGFIFCPTPIPQLNILIKLMIPGIIRPVIDMIIRKLMSGQSGMLIIVDTLIPASDRTSVGGILPPIPPMPPIGKPYISTDALAGAMSSLSASGAAAAAGAGAALPLKLPLTLPKLSLPGFSGVLAEVGDTGADAGAGADADADAGTGTGRAGTLVDALADMMDGSGAGAQVTAAVKASVAASGALVPALKTALSAALVQPVVDTLAQLLLPDMHRILHEHLAATLPVSLGDHVNATAAAGAVDALAAALPPPISEAIITALVRQLSTPLAHVTTAAATDAVVKAVVSATAGGVVQAVWEDSPVARHDCALCRSLGTHCHVCAAGEEWRDAAAATAESAAAWYGTYYATYFRVAAAAEGPAGGE